MSFTHLFLWQPWRKPWLYGLASVVLLVVCASLYLGYHVFWPAQHNRGYPLDFHIAKGKTLGQVSLELEQEGVVQSAEFFKTLAIMLGIDRQMKNGMYQIPGVVSLYDLYSMLLEGVPDESMKLLIPEGKQASQIFNILRKQGFENAGEYEHYAEDPAFLQSLDLFGQSRSLEGFLYPDTHFFAKHSSEQQVLLQFVSIFFQKLPKNYEARAQELGFTPYEILVIASIVEKETGHPDDRVLVSSVIHNRLRKRMRLQVDPTVIYGIKNFNGNLTRKDLRRKHPYNTYLIPGLPPTPISNPGAASIQAALYPAQTEYLYFVAKGNGRSYFSKTLKEHNSAVWKYQKAQRAQNYRSHP